MHIGSSSSDGRDRARRAARGGHVAHRRELGPRLRRLAELGRARPLPEHQDRPVGGAGGVDAVHASNGSTASGDRSHFYGGRLRDALPEPPSTYMAGRVYGCIFDDVHGLASRDAIGMGQIMFETDYPHSDSTYPDSRADRGEDRLVPPAWTSTRRGSCSAATRSSASTSGASASSDDRAPTSRARSSRPADFETRTTSRIASATPYKIGVCMDFAGGTPLARDFYDGIRLALDEASERGDARPSGRAGDPRGRRADARHQPRGAQRLARAGQRRGLPRDHRSGRDRGEPGDRRRGEPRLACPTISFCATFDWAGPYCYSLQNGGFPDEADVLAAYMRSAGPPPGRRVPRGRA